jgi:hypothetical protein
MRRVNRAGIVELMASNTKFPLKPKKARIAPSEAIPDGAQRLERKVDKGRPVAKSKKAKTAKSIVAGRMPERSEAISGDETDTRTLVSRQGPHK